MFEVNFKNNTMTQREKNLVLKGAKIFKVLSGLSRREIIHYAEDFDRTLIENNQDGEYRVYRENKLIAIGELGYTEEKAEKLILLL